MPLDYSKWNHIEVSDDEDDTHPNVDTPSLYRWRHQARMDRMDQDKQERDEFEKDLKKHITEYEDVKSKYQKALKQGRNLPETLELKNRMEAMEEADKKIQARQDDLKKRERLTPWNIDTICKEGKSKTLINSAPSYEPRRELTDDERVDSMKQFLKENDKLVKKYGMLHKPDDTQQFLIDNPKLVCEETANQLVLWCIDLAVQEKIELMNHVAHQCICMNFLLELAKSMKIDPRQCVRPFFSKFKQADAEYMKGFTEELEAFKDRVRKRAEIRVQEAMAKYEEEEKQKRLGPGGLDPVEVFESLPLELQQCFETKDVPRLEAAFSKMTQEEATNHLKRCVDSGLWVPGKKDDDGDAEEIYENVEGDGAPNAESSSTEKKDKNSADSTPSTSLS